MVWAMCQWSIHFQQMRNVLEVNKICEYNNNESIYGVGQAPASHPFPADNMI
jgi:hypothetical protein